MSDFVATRVQKEHRRRSKSSERESSLVLRLYTTMTDRSVLSDAQH